MSIGWSQNHFVLKNMGTPKFRKKNYRKSFKDNVLTSSAAELVN